MNKKSIKKYFLYVIINSGDNMTKRVRKKKKIKVKRIIIVLLALIILGFVIYKGLGLLKNNVKIITKNYYLTSNINKVDTYNYNEETLKMEDGEKLSRGTLVKSHDKTKVIDEITYTEVKKDDKVYYIKPENLTLDKDKIVTEKEKYVRTSVTVYKNELDSKIASLIKKGNKLDILSYDYIDSEGLVNMYKIKKDDIEGWVYRKYLVDTEEEAKADYNENGVYDTHKDRKYSYELYGGHASTLDYYPYEKPDFKDNPLLKTAKTMYLNAGVIKEIDSYLDIAKSSGVNAIVVDIKDGALGYPVEVAKEYSQTAYDSAINDFDEFKSAIDKIKEAGIYAIARIVVFNDSHYGHDHPEDCIESPVSSQKWPSAYSRGAWEYNVELAKAVVHDMGFNEVQFDYVRFPETAYNMSRNSNTNFKNKYDEEKAEAIQNFLFYATDQLHKEGVYLSVDVFGECSSEYVTSYGQYWPAISNIVDVVSSMPYTDHFGRNVDTWSNAYQTVYNWAKGAAKRQEEIPTPAVARTWITAYDTPYWNPSVVYGASKISDQAKALVDAGLKGGFITWNSASSLYKYNQIKDAFSKDY